MERTDVIVIGAGLAGLTAARTAAEAGARVIVLDGHPPGGRARSDERDGFILNRGPHALYRGGAAERVLHSLGIRPTGGAPGPLRGRRGDLISTLPAGGRTLVTTKLLGATSKVPVVVNGDAGVEMFRAGEPFIVMAVSVDADKVASIHIVVNPDKLTGLNDLAPG